MLLSGCSGNPEVQVNETSNKTSSYDETVHINNCGGKADSEQTKSHSFSTSVEGGIDVGVQQVVEGVISAKYGQYRNVSVSQRLVAPAGTNMEFVLRWSEEVRAGNVTVNGSTGTYKTNIPITVEQVSSRDSGCDITQNQEPNSDSISPPIETPVSSNGNLIYECNFDNSCQWNVEAGMKIENGMLLVSPGYDAVLGGASSFTNFILEAKFLLPPTGSMSFYIRHQRPACTDWNCSIQIGLYTQEVVARRFLGDKSNQQIDIIKNKSVTSFRSNDWNIIIIVANGNNYTVYMNDVLALEFTDDTYSSGSFIIDNAIDSIAEATIDYFRVYETQ